jgi:hypothetical protein
MLNSPTIELFDNPGVYYFFDAKINVFDDNWLVDHNKISRLNSYKLVIADFSSEHYGIQGVDHVYHAFEQQRVNFLLLSHDPADHFRLPNMVFFPHWYHWAKNSFETQNLPSFDHFKRQYLVGCQNRNTNRYHRVYNYLTIKNKSWFNSMLFTMYNYPLTKIREDDHTLDADLAEQWNQIRHSFPKFHRLDHCGILRAEYESDAHRGMLPGNTDAFINLVTESSMLPKIFVTEKTWRPIAAAQLFVIIGSPGTVSYLRDAGVDVFDDIIDHAHYDNVSDWQKRIHCAHQVLESLVTQDLEKIYQQTHQRRIDNVKKFYAGEFDHHGSLRYIIQCINTLN